MKKIVTITFCLVFMMISSYYSQGLERVIVEKYYVSDTNDAKAKLGGYLPSGSVTYRIYVDLDSGYKFQAVYGLPNHELKINTSTFFFNNNEFGSYIPNLIPKRTLEDNTIMLDSWISVGAASELTFGILKEDDNMVETIQNADSPMVLQNKSIIAGIPINVKDGLFSGIPPRVTAYHIDTVLSILNNSTIGSGFTITDGSWVCLTGSVGPTPENRVLIGQFTTDGVFSFELNIQVGTPDHKAKNYVAKNPVNNEIQLPSLMYNSFNNRDSLKNNFRKK